LLRNCVLFRERDRHSRQYARVINISTNAKAYQRERDRAR